MSCKVLIIQKYYFLGNPKNIHLWNLFVFLAFTLSLLLYNEDYNIYQ
jgi:hypothetical protein